MYSADSLHGVSPQLIRKYFTREQSGYRVNPPVQQLVRLAHLNLIRTWPMRGLFDAIFCRNVMIYFDRETQQELVRRFAGLIKPGGYLCVGHSESLFAAGQHGLEYIQPAVYVKAKLESSIQ
jgi:chemotaxis protein methyltransferase CheR